MKKNRQCILHARNLCQKLGFLAHFDEILKTIKNEFPKNLNYVSPLSIKSIIEYSEKDNEIQR